MRQSHRYHPRQAPAAWKTILLLGVVAALLTGPSCNNAEKSQPMQEPEENSTQDKPRAGAAKAALPAPAKEGKVSLEETLARRRSVRRFGADPLTRPQIAQLCWAAQGVSQPRTGFRTAPSAGALYPLELYVVSAGGVEHYVPGKHTLEMHLEGDQRKKLQAAALNQAWVGQAPATFVLTAVFARTQRKYGPRSGRYVYMEAGHAGQNLLLQATALGLGSVPVGAFVDNQVTKALKLPAKHVPVYLIPVGAPAR